MRPGTYSDPKVEKSARRMGRRLATVTDPNGGKCMMLGCKRPAQATGGQGFSQTHCRYHVQFKARHGSYWKGTYSRADLEPYRTAAMRFIKDRWREKDTEAALYGFQDLLNWGGRKVLGPDLARQSPEVKAQAALWRLNDAGVLPLTLLVDHLAISAAVLDEFSGGDDEFRLVQIAKAYVRKASGWHKEYDTAPTWHVYPKSSGLFLRVLGDKVEKACGGFTAEHVEALRAMRQAARKWTPEMMQRPLS